MTNNQTQNKENSARGTNVRNIKTEHRENSVRKINVTNNQTELKENSSRDTNVANSAQHTNAINNLIRQKRKTMQQTLT